MLAPDLSNGLFLWQLNKCCNHVGVVRHVVLSIDSEARQSEVNAAAEKATLHTLPKVAIRERVSQCRVTVC